MAKASSSTAKPASASKDSAATKQTSLLGFFGRAGQPPPSSNPNKSIPQGVHETASTNGASKSNGTRNSAFPSKIPTTPPTVSQQPATSASARTHIDLDTPDTTLSIGETVSSPPVATPDIIRSSGDANPDDAMDVDDVVIIAASGEEKVKIDDNEDDDQVIARTSRRSAKKRVVYEESESEDGISIDSTTPAHKDPPSARSAKKRRMEDSDDEFEMDVNGFDDAELDIAFAQFDEKSPSLSVPSEPGDESDVPRKTKSSKSIKTSSSQSKPKRPLPRPLGGSSSSSSRLASGNGGSGSNAFITQAERSKLDAKEKKREEQDCFEFLKDLRDADKHRPNDPDYDPRTVYIPSSAWNEFTPFEKQFWEIKQTHFDTVLFFQKGKFFELYENDAEIGHAEFDLKLTDRVKMKMVGVPEQSFDFWAAKFLAAGYKVGKVEQAETAIGMEMRNKGNAKGGGDKIVRRELASVFTNGTVVDEAFLAGDDASHCVAIKEYSETDTRPSTYGVCILDAATGQFELTHFQDDACRTKLETLFRTLRPKEILHAKGNLTVATNRLLRNILPMSTSWVALRPDSEFYDAATTKDKLVDFFGADMISGMAVDGEPPVNSGLPPAIVEMLDKPLAMEALGGMIFYLQSLNMDKDLLSQKSFNVYDPIRKGETMTLDGQSLSHLEVLVNNEGTEEGTLLQLLQRCRTPFGKRLFRIWLSMPLTNAAAINMRLDAVQDLMEHTMISETFNKVCRSMPDMERIISRIHAGKCKQADFLKVVQSFRQIQSGFGTMLNAAKHFKSASLASLLEGAPDLSSYVEHITGQFVVENSTILPASGADDDCDAAVDAVNEVEQQLEDVLIRYQGDLKCRNLTYWHSNLGTKDVYQIQAPSNFKPPSNWTKQSSTKNLARYITRESAPLIREVQEARETRKVAFQNFFGHLLLEFDKDREVWLKAVRVLAELDCLLSLAKASADLDEPKCRPTIVESEQSFVDFKDLRHPAMCLRSDFISNNVQLGGVVPRQALLTGPNTAGKSTLCRMTAVAVIMAQLGAMVPASSASLSPIDKIQTRMGAYDNMFSSASTFKVELDECSKILKEAGPRSLVILDELGRGTSTYDGMAIAEAVLHHIATHNLPLGFFATHYGALTDDFQYHPNIRCMYMQTQVDNEKRQVVCLYKLIPGRAESSYGTHVAHLAGVPDSVVSRAETVSGEFFDAFNKKLATRRRSALPVVAQADFRFLMSLFNDSDDKSDINLGSKAAQLRIIREAIGGYTKILVWLAADIDSTHVRSSGAPDNPSSVLASAYIHGRHVDLGALSSSSPACKLQTETAAVFPLPSAAEGDMDVPSGSPPPGDNLPYFHTAVGTDSGPPVLQHISGDLSDPRSIDMFGLESALGEDLDVDALQTKLPTSDTVAAHEALKWETQRVWLGTQLGWTSVRWTVGRNRLFACVGSSEIDGKPQSTRLEPLILQLISAKNDDLDDNGSSSALTGKPFSKTSSLTPVPKYTFVDRARDQVFKSSTWEAGIKDERMSQGVSDIRNLLVQRPDVGEACGRTTGNKWILGKAQPFVADSRHDAADRSEVYVVVDRKEASLVDADYDLRWFTKTHTSALPST